MPANHTVTLYRALRTTPEKLYRAFTEPDALAAWLPPHGYVCTVHEQHVAAGGHYRMQFRNFTTGQVQAWSGHYLEVQPNELLRYTDRFDDPALPGETTTTVRIAPVSVGAELRIVQENIPAPIPVDGCYASWQECLNKLARLVEADVRDVQTGIKNYRMKNE